MNQHSERTVWQRLLREPLLQFVIIGASIFLLSDLVGTPGSAPLQPTITVDGAEADRLVQLWERMRMRPPSEDEYRDLIDQYIRDEVMYREALAMGLDKNDMVVRHRLKEKLEFLTDNLMVGAPDDATLQAYFEEQSERYRKPDRISFAQVYFSPEIRQERAEEDARQALGELGANPFDTPESLDLIGDAIELDAINENITLAQMRKQFGSHFAEAVWQQAPGRWVGPLPSGFGLHNVYVREVTTGEIPGLAEVRGEVLSDYQQWEREKAIDAVYERFKQRYQIIVEDEVWQPRRRAGSSEVAAQ